MTEYPYTYRIVACQTCAEEILVERVLIGTDHTMDIIASHKQCLKKKGVGTKFKEKYPDIAKKLGEWL